MGKRNVDPWRGRRVDKETERNVLETYVRDQTESCKSVGDKYGLHPSRVSRILRRHGIRPRGDVDTTEERRKLAKRTAPRDVGSGGKSFFQYYVEAVRNEGYRGTFGEWSEEHGVD